MMAADTATEEEQVEVEDLAIDGKGLENMDINEISRMVRELREQRREIDHERRTILDMRRAIIFLCVFTLSLTFAMLGVSFVAARLAKDTTVTETHALADKASGESLSTIGGSRMYPIYLPPENKTDGRRLFAFSDRRATREMRRRINEKHEREYGRELFQGLNRKRGWGPGSSTRSSSSTFSSDCDTFEGYTDYSTFQKMKYSARSGETTSTFFFEDGGYLYQTSLDMQSVFIDDDTDSMVIEGRMNADCYGSGCDVYKEMYVIDDCHYESAAYTYLGSRSSGGRHRGRGKRRTGFSSRSDTGTYNEGRTMCALYSCELQPVGGNTYLYSDSNVRVYNMDSDSDDSRNANNDDSDTDSDEDSYDGGSWYNGQFNP